MSTTKNGSSKSREQIERDATNLAAGFVLAGVVLFVIAFFLEQYKVPITFLGTTVGYDYPYAGISSVVLPASIVIGIVGCVVGVAYYYSSIRTSYFGGPVPHGEIFCRYCGKEIRSDAVFCPECGRRLT